MTHEEKLRELEESIVNLDLHKAPELCKGAINSGVPPEEIFKVISRAMDTVGKRYESGELFLSELIMAGEVVKEILKIIEPLYNIWEKQPLGKVVLATVRGDLHDIGKNIVAMVLKSAGFKIIDLGVDVPPEKIAEAAKESEADVVGLSALLTTTVPEIKYVVEELKKRGIRDKVKVMVGGAAVNEEIAERYGADAYGRTAIDGVKICRKWLGEGT